MKLQPMSACELLKLRFPVVDEHPVVDDLKLAEQIQVVPFFLQDLLQFVGKLDFE